MKLIAHKWAIFCIAAAFMTCPVSLIVAQEKSVRPGVNDTFRDPDPKAFTERFEIESREVFAKRKEILDASKLKENYMVVFERNRQDRAATPPALLFPIIEGYGVVVAVADAVAARHVELFDRFPGNVLVKR